jgi:serine O-acetyltransferase
MTLIRTIQEDYRRHGSSPGNLAFWALANHRYGRWADELPEPLRALGGRVYGALSWIIEVASGITLHREATLGEDFHLVHAGNIKIHPLSRIGNRVGIMHDVTLGTAMDRPGAPTLGDDVFVGAGAKILGAVTIGARAVIAANSLVITDVPADATAIGVPAKIMHYTGRFAAKCAPPPPGANSVASPGEDFVQGGNARMARRA